MSKKTAEDLVKDEFVKGVNETMKEDECICKCGKNIIEDEKVLVLNPGKKNEEHMCLMCAFNRKLL